MKAGKTPPRWPSIYRVHKAPVADLTFSHDQSSIFTCSWDGTLWCLPIDGTGARILRIRSCLFAVAEVAGSIFCSDEFGNLHSCRASGEERSRHQLNHASIHSIDCIWDGRGLVLALGGFDFTTYTLSTAVAAIWDVSKEKIVQIYRNPTHQVVQVRAVKSSPLDNRFLSISTLLDENCLEHHHLQEWHFGHTDPIRDIPLTDGIPLCVDYSPCGRYATIGSGEFNGLLLRDESCNISVVDLESGMLIENRLMHDHAVTQVRHHPNGFLTFSTSQNQCKIYDSITKNGHLILQLDSRITAFSLSKGGEIAAIGCADGSIAIIDCPL